MTDDLPKEVLVVEDEPLTRMVAADAMAKRGIMAWEAADAEEALTLLKDHPRIGLLFTDVDMPGQMDGLELAQEVSISHPGVGLIVTSGAFQMADKDLPDHGTFLPKPYLTVKLAKLVSQKLGFD